MLVTMAWAFGCSSRFFRHLVNMWRWLHGLLSSNGEMREFVLCSAKLMVGRSMRRHCSEASHLLNGCSHKLPSQVWLGLLFF